MDLTDLGILLMAIAPLACAAAVWWDYLVLWRSGRETISERVWRTPLLRAIVLGGMALYALLGFGLALHFLGKLWGP